jgi:hypothetical protein
MRTYEDTFSGDKIYPGKVRVVPNTISLILSCVATRHNICKRSAADWGFTRRESCTFVAITRSSVSKMAKVNRFSFNEKILVE